MRWSLWGDYQFEIRFLSMARAAGLDLGLNLKTVRHSALALASACAVDPRPKGAASSISFIPILLSQWHDMTREIKVNIKKKLKMKMIPN